MNQDARTDITIDELLRDMVAQKASDIHIKAGNPPGFRIDGEIRRQHQYGRLMPEDTQRLAKQIMSPELEARFAADNDVDFSYSVQGLARFRVNALIQRGSIAMVMRQIPDSPPTVESLGLPKVCLELARKPRGLVLVTGPTGSGKSTTLAAMIDYINQTQQGHILTMEDPLEFMHRDKECFVTQRQIGMDTKSFAEGLRRALRQDPDVILIGEMRDLETISLAITAAETGHLVFGTLHTTSAVSTVDRIIDVFPADAQQQVRVQLAATLQGVISQCLVPKIGGGRVAAREILIASDGVRSLIREGKTPQIVNMMQTGKAIGMTTLENELIALVRAAQITPEDAVGKANRPDEIERTTGKIQSGPQSAFGGGMGGGSDRSTATPSSPRASSITKAVQPNSMFKKR